LGFFPFSPPGPDHSRTFVPSFPALLSPPPLSPSSLPPLPPSLTPSCPFLNPVHFIPIRCTRQMLQNGLGAHSDSVGGNSYHGYDADDTAACADGVPEFVDPFVDPFVARGDEEGAASALWMPSEGLTTPSAVRISPCGGDSTTNVLFFSPRDERTGPSSAVDGYARILV